MKFKKILLSLIMCFIITGCGNEPVTLDLEKVEIEINNMEIDGEKVFDSNQKLSDDAIKGRNITLSLYDEILMSLPTNSTDVDMYIVYLPKEGSEEKCTKEIEGFISSLYDTYSMYLPEEAKLLKNYEKEIYGDYHIYVVSENSSDVISKIKSIK